MNTPPVIAYVFEYYPVLSQTFLRREITALQEHGLRVKIFALFENRDNQKIPALEGVEVEYFGKWEVLKLLYALPLEFLRNPKFFFAAWRRWRQTKFTYAENRLSTIWAIIFAVSRAAQFRREKPAMVHGVRATAAASAAAILSRLTEIPYSFGAHAYDIYRHGGDALLKPKLLTANFVHTTTESAAKYLHERAGSDSANIILARRGLLELPQIDRQPRDDGTTRLLSVGRLVSKKGQNRQIAACKILDGWGILLEARIIGEGPLWEKLQTQIDRAGLTHCVKLVGALTSEQTDQQYRWADIFWHTGVVDPAGDRDGLPNVIPEAMAHGLPIISSDLPELREVIEHDTDGFIVDTEDDLALANAVTRLAEHPELARRLGENGRRWVEENFMAAKNTAILAEAFKTMGSRIGK